MKEEAKDEQEQIMELFLHEKPVGIILSMKDSDEKYASVISKEVDCTYTHVLKILMQFQQYGIVEFKKQGRIKKVMLTDVGGDIAHELEGLKRQLGRLAGEKLRETLEKSNENHPEKSKDEQEKSNGNHPEKSKENPGQSRENTLEQSRENSSNDLL